MRASFLRHCTSSKRCDIGRRERVGRAKKSLRLVHPGELTGFEKGDTRAKEQSFPKVMSDEKNCFSQLLLNGEKFLLYLGARERIECAKRLVH